MAEHEEITVTKRKIVCKKCGSTDTSKNGKYNDSQYFLCKNCGMNFSGSNSYFKMKYPKDHNIKALTYYYNGMSYRNINHTFNDILEVSLPKSTFYRWVIKFSKLVNNYVLTLHPQLSDTWIADETVIDIWGKKYWFWDIIDEDTRFLIASHISRVRSIKEATKLFYMAKLRSNIRPKVIRTDKMVSYHGAFNKVFYARSWDKKVMHLTSEGFGSDFNINLIERFHGTIKQRTKVMRDLKRLKSARIVLDGFVTHYNFLMEHSYLNYKTPATIAGIGDRITNWGDLIELAINSPKYNPGKDIDWEKEFGIK